MPLRKSLNFVFASFGYSLIRRDEAKAFPVEATARDREILQLVREYTMTTPERIWALLSSVKYIVANRVPGAFVECGVWRGGSAMVIAYALQDCGDTDRRLWLYDTFEGMTEPSIADVELATGKSASSLMAVSKKGGKRNIWCDSPPVRGHEQRREDGLSDGACRAGEGGRVGDTANARAEQDRTASTGYGLIRVHEGRTRSAVSALAKRRGLHSG